MSDLEKQLVKVLNDEETKSKSKEVKKSEENVEKEEENKDVESKNSNSDNESENAHTDNDSDDDSDDDDSDSEFEEIDVTDNPLYQVLSAFFETEEGENLCDVLKDLNESVRENTKMLNKLLKTPRR